MRGRSAQDLVGGLALVALSVLAFSQISDLDMGRAARMGPGYFPTLLAGGVGLFGLVIAGRGLIVAGPGLDSWGWRHLLPVIVAIIFFSFAIRPLGMVVAGAGIVLIGSFAAPDLRWRETLLFGAGLVLFTVLLFKVALNLPLAIWPRF